MSEITITTESAPLSDPRALARLLDEVPESQDLRAQLARPCFTRRWQPAGQRSYWIESDGTTVQCVTLDGLEPDEVIALWLSVDAYRRRPGFALSASALGQILETELGLSVELPE